MLLFWLSPGYIVGLIVWIGLMWFALKRLLRARRTAPRTRGVSIGLGVWTFLAGLTFIELVFALGVDHSEAFNASLIAQRWYARNFDSQRNIDGFRDRRLMGEELPAGGKRLVFVGDSFTAGHGIDRMEDRFTEQLESKLHQSGLTQWQVHNLGEPGYDVSLVKGLIGALIREKYEIDGIVYCYMMNDIEGYDPRTTEEIQKIDSKRQSGNWLVGHLYSLNWAYHRWVQYSSGSRFDYFPHLADSYRGGPWEGTSKDLDSMRSMCADHGISFRIVVFPFLQNLGPEYPFREAHAQLLTWGQQHQVPILDMLPLLEKHLSEGLTVNPFDNHPSIHANTLFATALEEWLRPELEGNPNPANRVTE